MEEEGDGLISEGSCYGANYLGVVNGLRIGVLLRLEGEVSVTEADTLLISLLEIALGPENTGARNTHTDKLLDELLGGDVNNVKVKKDGIPPISVLTLCGVYGNSLDSLKACESLIVHCGILKAALEVPVIKSFKLAKTDHRLHLGHTVVEAYSSVNVRKLLLKSKHIHSGTNVVSVVTEGTALPSEILVVGDDHTALTACGEVLGLTEGIAAYVTYKTNHSILVLTADTLCAVLYYEEVVLLRDLKNGTHISNYTVKVNYNDSLGLRSDKSLDALGIKGVILGNITEYGNSARLNYREGGSDEGIGRNDNLVAGAYAESRESDVKRRGTVCTGYSELSARPLSERILKLHTDLTCPVVYLTGIKNLGNLCGYFGSKLRPTGEADLFNTGAIHYKIFFFSHDICLS